MSWESMERNLEKGPFRAFLYLFGLVFLCLAVVGTCTFVINPLVQGRRVLEKTFDAENVITQYEWFKQRYQDIQAINVKIITAGEAVSSFMDSAGPRKDWHREDREEHSRLHSIYMGLKYQRYDLVAQYNAKSKMVNRSIFKAGDIELPAEIPLD